MHKKFKPNNTKELKLLVDDESIDLNDIDTSLITNMTDLFKCSHRKNYDGIENWDTSNVENMHGLFSFNAYFNNDISKWNVSKVKIMSEMFHFALCFNKPLNDWNVSNVESMNMMFQSAKEFNQSLDKWNVSKVKNMRGMFADALKFDGDINNWNVSYVEAMDNMFNGALEFNKPLNKWNVSKVESMNKMFANTNKFDQDLDSWDIKNLYSMTSMFENSFMCKNDKISLKFKIYSYCLENNNEDEDNKDDTTDLPYCEDEDLDLDIPTFDDSAKYDYDPANLEVKSGRSNVLMPPEGSEEKTYTVTTNSTNSLTVDSSTPFSYGTIEATVTQTQANDAGIIFKCEDNGLDEFWEGTVAYYFFFLSKDGTAYLGKTDYGNWSELAVSSKIAGYSLGDSVNLKVVLKGTKILCFGGGI